MLTNTLESTLKFYYDQQPRPSYCLLNTSFLKTSSSVMKIVKKSPLSNYETYSIKPSLHFSNEKDTKSLYDNKNRNRSNPHPNKVFIITIHHHQNKNKEQFDYKQILINNITNQRKQKAIMISSFIKKKMMEIKQKRQILLRQVLKMRMKMIIRLQSFIKGWLIRKDMRNLYACDLLFFYEINENLIHKLSKANNDDNNTINNNNGIYSKGTVDIKLNLISNSQKKKEITFSYCKTLKYHYLPLLKKGVIKNKYRVNFIINNQTIIDPRYEVDNDEKGNFYNMISKSMLHDFKKNKETNKITTPKPPTKLYWETIFKMKSKSKRHSNSCDSLSVSNNTELSNEYFITPHMPIYHTESNTTTNIKSILKNSFLKDNTYSSRKRRIGLMNHHVKFNTTIQYSY